MPKLKNKNRKLALLLVFIMLLQINVSHNIMNARGGISTEQPTINARLSTPTTMSSDPALLKDTITINYFKAGESEIPAGVTTTVTVNALFSSITNDIASVAGSQIRVSIPDNVIYIKYTDHIAGFDTVEPTAENRFITFIVNENFAFGDGRDLPFQVMFPNGITPNGETATFSVSVYDKNGVLVSTDSTPLPEPVTITAIAASRWYAGVSASLNAAYLKHEASNTITVPNSFSFTFKTSNDRVGKSEETIYTDEVTLIGKLEIPPTIELTPANLDLGGGYTLVDTGITAPYTKEDLNATLGALTTADPLLYKVYSIYYNNAEGLRAVNENQGISDMASIQKVLTLTDFNFIINDKSQMASTSLYSYGAVIFAYAEANYNIFTDSETRQAVKQDKVASKIYMYQNIPQQNYPADTRTSFNKTLKSGSPTTIPIKNAQGVITKNAISFYLSSFTNPYTERIASTSKFYYIEEYLSDYVVADEARPQVESDIWSYADLTEMTTGSFTLNTGSTHEFRSQYSDLMFQIQFKEQGGDWENLGDKLPVFELINGVYVVRTSTTINLTTHASTQGKTIVGIRWIFGLNRPGSPLDQTVPPGFSVSTVPYLNFTFKDTTQGINTVENTASVTYKRPTKSAPETYKASASISYIDTDSIYITNKKSARNLSSTNESSNIFYAGDTVEYKIALKNDSLAAAVPLDISKLAVTDTPDPKLNLGDFQNFKVNILNAAGYSRELTSNKYTHTINGATSTISFAFKNIEETDYLAPGETLNIVYTVKVPENINFGSGASVPLANSFVYSISDGFGGTIGAPVGGNCTIAVNKDVPQLGIKKYKTDNKAFYRVEEEVSFAIEANHFSGGFSNPNQKILIMDTYPIGFDLSTDATKNLFLNSIEVYLIQNSSTVPVSRKLAANEYELYVDSLLTKRQFTVAVESNLFEKDTIIKINYKMKLAGEGSQDIGKIDFNSRPDPVVKNNDVYLAIHNPDTTAQSTAFLYDLGEWGRDKATNTAMQNSPAATVNYSFVIHSLTDITILKTPRTLGLTKQVTDYIAPDSSNIYYVKYKVTLTNFSTVDLNIPTGNNIRDILPKGQEYYPVAIEGKTGSGPATLTYFSTLAASSNKYNVPDFVTSVMGRTDDGNQIVDFVNIRKTADGTIPKQTKVEVDYWVKGDATIANTETVRLQNWVSFKPGTTFALQDDINYGTIEHVKTKTIYGYPVDTEVEYRNYFIEAYCDVSAESTFIRPSIQKEVMLVDANGKMTPAPDGYNFFPGTEVLWRITIRNGIGSTADMISYKLKDVLPSGYQYLASAKTYVHNTADDYLNGRTEIGSDKILTDTLNDNQTLEWDLGNRTLAPGKAIYLTFKTEIPAGVYATSVNNAYLVPSPEQNWWQYQNALGGKLISSNESGTLFGEADTKALQAQDMVDAYGVYAIKSDERVQNLSGTSSAGRSDNPILINQGETFQYNMTVTNNGTYSFKDLVLINVFPHESDTGVHLTGQNRGSQWAPLNPAQVQVYMDNILLNPENYMIEYSDKTGNELTDADWKGTTYWDAVVQASSKSLRVRLLGVNLLPSSSGTPHVLKVTFTMTAPKDLSLSGSTAWNTFAFEATSVDKSGIEDIRLRVEPPRVGVTLDSSMLEITKKIKDYSTARDNNATFVFTIEEANADGSVVSGGIKTTLPVTMTGDASNASIALFPGYYKITEQDALNYTLEKFTRTDPPSTYQQAIVVKVDSTKVIKVEAENVFVSTRIPPPTVTEDTGNTPGPGPSPDPSPSPSQGATTTPGTSPSPDPSASAAPGASPGPSTSPSENPTEVPWTEPEPTPTPNTIGIVPDIPPAGKVTIDEKDYTLVYDPETDMFMVLDADGVPLGYVKTPEEFMTLEDLIPFGKINPKTSDYIISNIAALGISTAAEMIIVIKYINKRRKHS